MKIISYGDGIHYGSLSLHSGFSKAANYSDGDRLVSLVHDSVGPGPLNIVLSKTQQPWPERIEITHKGIFVAGRFMPFASAAKYRSAPDLRPESAANIKASFHVFEKTVLARAQEMSLVVLFAPEREKYFAGGFASGLLRRVKEALAKFQAGDVKALSSLCGAGFGLTPSGDDFIAGVLHGLYVCRRCGVGGEQPRRELFEACGEASFVSREFIRCAYEGRMPSALKKVVAALAAADEKNISAHALDLLRCGSTSGADTAAGFIAAIRTGGLSCR